jgi:hypothetical protein
VAPLQNLPAVSGPSFGGYAGSPVGRHCAPPSSDFRQAVNVEVSDSSPPLIAQK